jgi:hypothetical protein
MWQANDPWLINIRALQDKCVSSFLANFSHLEGPRIHKLLQSKIRLSLSVIKDSVLEPQKYGAATCISRTFQGTYVIYKHSFTRCMNQCCYITVDSAITAL